MIYFKKIVLPLILSASIYLICWLLTFGKFNVFAFICTIAFAYLIRLLDDLFDYENDRKEGKALLTKPTLLTLSIVLLVAYIILPIGVQLYYLLIPVCTLPLLYFKYKVFVYLRTLIIPTYISMVVLANFSFTIWVIIFITALFVLDLAFVIIKEKKNAIN